MKRRLAIAFLAVTCTGGTLYAGLQISESSARARSEEIAEELAEWRAGIDVDREVLWGRAAEGAAWPHYERALGTIDAEARELRDKVLKAVGTMNGGDEITSIDRAELLERFRTVLADVRLGAHATDPRVGDPSLGFRAVYPKLRSVRALSDLSVLRLLMAEEPEEQLEAVRSVLDVQQCGRDLASSPLLITEMIGLAVLVPSGLTDHLRDGLVDRMSLESKREWLLGLERLERDLTVESVAIRGELEACAHGFLVEEESVLAASAGWIESIVDDKTYIFRMQHRVAEYLESFLELAPVIDDHYRASGREGYEALLEIGRRAENGGNPIAAVCAPKFASAMVSRHWNRTRLSFLRHALALHLGEESAPPLDLFGNGVEVEQRDGRVRVATTDPNGQVLEIEL